MARAGKRLVRGHSLANPGGVDMQVNGNPLRALSRWYAQTGDKSSRQLAAKVARFMTKRGPWGSTAEGPSMADSYEHARWQGHFHWFATGVVGLADYATTTNDVQLLRYLKSYYEYSRQFGIVRIGFFPAVSHRWLSGGVPARRSTVDPGENDEGCALVDMLDIALMLSEAGVGTTGTTLTRWSAITWSNIKCSTANASSTLSRIRRSPRCDPKSITPRT
ncbi:MAG: hypothetical protein Ct9H300mP1_22930 [Planctomycetaceae bacterium]|nr:MAG: hypothetical protein Ct9H300mP1_22930 [Planctomycetaceae bacterium]